MDTQSQLQAVGTKLREPGEVRRVTVKLTPDAYDSVRETADALELSLTSLIRQSIAMFRFFAVEHKNSQVFIKEDGETREVILFNAR